MRSCNKWNVTEMLNEKILFSTWLIEAKSNMTVNRKVPRFCIGAICGWNRNLQFHIISHVVLPPVVCTNCLYYPRFIPPAIQQTPYVDPMLVECWATVFDVGPTLNQHWFKALCPPARWSARLHAATYTKILIRPHSLGDYIYSNCVETNQ